MQIGPNEYGRLHVFAVNRPRADIAPRHKPPATGMDRLQPSGALLADLTGTADLDAAGAELIPLDDLEGLGLSGYLAEGYEVDPDALALHERKLDALEGYCLILRSQAFGGAAFTLAETADLTHIASFDQPGTDWTATGTIKSEAAKPFTAPAPPPRAQRARAQKLGGIVFAAFMLLIVMIVWFVLT